MLCQLMVMLFCLFVCLFVCLGFIVPLENVSLIWRRHHYRWIVANFDLCSALMAIDLWEFFSVPHLLFISVYNGHLRGPVTLTSITERLEVELSLPVCTTKVWDSKSHNLPFAGSILEPIASPPRSLVILTHDLCLWLKNITMLTAPFNSAK